MSMVNELIKRLKRIAAGLGLYDDRNPGKDARTIGEAIEIIEALSEKLHVANMERSIAHYHNGWIPCVERMPVKNGSYLIQVDSSDGTATITFMMVDHFNEDGTWVHCDNKRRKVVAWMLLPDPYQMDQLQEAAASAGDDADLPTMMPGA